MTIDLELYKAAVAKLAAESGESYVSLKMEINQHEGNPTVDVDWSCYTPSSGHTRRHATPDAALNDTRIACADPGKLLDQAKAFEAEAQRLRNRVPKELGGAL